MSIIEHLLDNVKKLNVDEVRYEEKRLELKEEQLLKRVEEYELDKDRLFRRGASCKSLTLRRIYARKFEDLTRRIRDGEQDLLKLGKQLRLLNRLRLLFERKSDNVVSNILKRLSESQLNEIISMIERSDIKEGEFLEKVDTMFGITDKTSEAEELGEEGKEVMKLWERIDQGKLKVEYGLSHKQKGLEKT